MARAILFVAILGLAAVANSCGAQLLPATDYIDVTNYDRNSIAHMDAFRKLVEDFGREDTDEMLDFIWKLKKDIQGLAERKVTDDRYFVINRVGFEGVTGLKTIVDNIQAIGYKHYPRPAFKTLFDLIKVYFGKDLEDFASGKPSRYPKLHSLLREIARRALKELLEGIMEKIESQSEQEGSEIDAEKRMEIIITQEPENDYSDAELISKARKMDLLKSDFEAKSMLEAFKKYSGKEDVSLYESIEAACSDFEAIYGLEVESFTWSLLLIYGWIDKERASRDRFVRRVEFRRVCLPVINSKNEDSLRNNVARNLGLPYNVAPDLPKKKGIKGLFCIGASGTKC